MNAADSVTGDPYTVDTDKNYRQKQASIDDYVMADMRGYQQRPQTAQVKVKRTLNTNTAKNSQANVAKQFKLKSLH